MKIYLVIVFLFSGLLCFSQSVEKENYNCELILKHCQKKTVSRSHLRKGFRNNPFDYTLWFYKTILSEQLSGHCGFVPSCSSFSLRAIHELGYIKGIFLTADRLTRCNGYVLQESPAYLISANHAKVNDFPAQYKSGK